MVAMSSRLGRAGLAPYTEEDEATTTWGRPWRRAASSTSMVPVALVGGWPWGRPASGGPRAGRPGARRRRHRGAPRPGGRRRGSIPRPARRGRAPARFAACPVDRSSRATTSSTVGNERPAHRQRLAPMKPAPPVTTTFMRAGRHRSRPGIWHRPAPGPLLSDAPAQTTAARRWGRPGGCGCRARRWRGFGPGRSRRRRGRSR